MTLLTFPVLLLNDPSFLLNIGACHIEYLRFIFVMMTHRGKAKILKSSRGELWYLLTLLKKRDGTNRTHVVVPLDWGIV